MHLPGENIPKMFIERWNFSSENEWKTHPLGWRCGTLRCVRGVAKSYHPPRGGECNHPPRGGAQRWAEGPKRFKKGRKKGRNNHHTICMGFYFIFFGSRMTNGEVQVFTMVHYVVHTHTHLVLDRAWSGAGRISSTNTSGSSFDRSSAGREDPPG